MKLYSVEDLKQRYEDKPSSATIYKYFKRKELEQYIVFDNGKKITEEGVIVLDKIRETNKKYRGEAKVEQDIPFNNKSACKEVVEPSNDYSLIIQTLNEQLKIKDKQLEEKDQQLNKLYDLLEQHTQTITLQTRTLQLKEGKDIILEQAENKEPVIYQEQEEVKTKKGFWSWLTNK